MNLLNKTWNKFKTIPNHLEVVKNKAKKKLEAFNNLKQVKSYPDEGFVWIKDDSQEDVWVVYKKLSQEDMVREIKKNIKEIKQQKLKLHSLEHNTKANQNVLKRMKGSELCSH